jgi:predicted ester cyclase
MMRTAFPDLEWTIEEQVAEGDKVACYRPFGSFLTKGYSIFVKARGLPSK